MSTYVPIASNNPKLVVKSHFGVETSALHPHRAINRGVFGLESNEARPTVLPSMFLATVTAKELSEIKDQANPNHGINLVRTKFEKEKEALHRESVEKSKLWPKTIIGERIRGLQRISERQANLEAEKEKIDAEWHAIVVKEREAKLAKARALQKSLASPEIRALHSKLALSNVLYERDRQVEHKKQLDALFKAHEFDGKALVQRAQKAHVMELVKAEMKKREARKIAMEYPLVIKQKRDAKMKQKEEDRIFQNQVAKASLQELEEEKEAVRMWKQAGFHEVEAAYWKAMDLKKEKQQKDKEDEANMFLEHRIYNDMREAIAKGRAGVTTDKRAGQERVYNKVAEMNSELAIESSKRIDNAVAVMSNAHKDRALIREQTDRAKKIALELDVAMGRNNQVAFIQQEKEREKQDGIATRKVLDNDFEEFQKMTVEQKKAKVDSLRKHHHSLLEQIVANKALNEKRVAENKKLDRDLMEQHEKESKGYIDVANAAIDEFRKEGKNIATAIHIVHPRQPFPPVQFETRYNTFARLGFI
ncbi:hypothetical protein HDU99_001951 [Rhizoclosmatium hyalinum]|nr:hypothetical protein HDU99_001951 [Rhizoclosmatium hyalinum]